MTIIWFETPFNEKIINKIVHIITWVNSWETKFLIHILKIQVDWSKLRDRNAKGEIRTSIFTYIKRMEYVNTRLIKGNGSSAV